MSVLLILVFISIVFSLAGVLALGQSLRRGDASRAEHLSLLPLEDERREYPCKKLE